MNESELSPLMRQFWDVKRAHPEAIVFFRVGDFYEMFYDDAEIASKILNIALTSRDKSKPNPVPLCGIPYHASQNYIAKLLQAGQTVALCEQVEDPKLTKGLVRREVVHVYTPGTLTESELLSAVESNFLAAIYEGLSPQAGVTRRSCVGIAALELSTGEFWATEFSGDEAILRLEDELVKLEPRELLYPKTMHERFSPLFVSLKRTRTCGQDLSHFDYSQATTILQTQFTVSSLSVFGCEDLTSGLVAAGAVLRYVQDTQPNSRHEHIRRLSRPRCDEEMYLDSVTIRNLELTTPLIDTPARNRSTPYTLLDVLNHTSTAMGSRLLREWITHPLIQVDRIRLRLDAVEELVQQTQVRIQLRVALKKIQDMIRLSSRVSLGVANPREVQSLQESMSILPEIGESLSSLSSTLFQDQVGQWDSLSDLSILIRDALVPDAPVSIKEGGIIQSGFHAQLDEYRTTSREGKERMTRMEAKERAETGIDSLKVRFNSVFGYYIEVTKANLSRVPDRYHRKQTLTNAERFTTPELKHLEEVVTQANLQVTQLEQELFEGIRNDVAQHTERIQTMGSRLATIDVLTSFAEAASLYQYVKPDLHEGGRFSVSDGRHPVVERLTQPSGFIPNDTLIDFDDNRLLLITGPNMAGKSTYLRQVGHIALMAHIGSFVPAKTATIGVIDRIFTRVGASDNLAAGHSTFMVEMTETAKILHCASKRSLILLDEIGRGTSTYDGLSIAWAVAEFIQDRNYLGARTLFAIHYHEMTELATNREGVRNYTVAVREKDGDILFLRKIIEGTADRSYGIHVAKLAGLPSTVIGRAQEVLSQLEQSSSQTTPNPELKEPFVQLTLQPSQASLPSPHPIIEEMRQIDLFSMTPLEALNRLAELQQKLDE